MEVRFDNAAAAAGGGITSVVAGAGLTGGAASGAATLDVIANADASITVNADDIQVAALGITAAKIAADAVTTVKILDANVTSAKLAMTGADGTFFCRQSSAWVAGNTADYYAATGTLPAATGGLRFGNNGTSQPLVTVRNSANTNDLSALHFITSNVLDVGSDGAGATVAKQFNQIRIYGAAFVDIGVSTTLYLRCNASLIGSGFPIVGQTSSPYAVHGRAAQAMADANQTLANTIYSRTVVRTTGAITADRTITFPHPSSEDRSYWKMIENDCTGAFNVVVSTATGVTVSVPNGKKQLLQFTPDGVEAVAAAL